jgi:hypothetical protein
LFSYIDLVRGEFILEFGERLEVAIADEETDAWRTLGDVSLDQ